MAAEKTKTEAPKTYRIKLPKTREKQADAVVAINGFTTVIQRGVEVEVSAPVYEVLQNSEKMDQLALEKREELRSRSSK